MNTAGYRFNQSDKNDRNQYSFRFDYQLNEAHHFEFVHQRFKETDDRTDLDAIHQRPVVYTSSDVTNGGSTDYHALQTELRRRFAGGIFGQVNYTFSKVLSNTPGTTQARFEPFIDNARPQLEKTRADFDVTHILNGSAIFELPFGPGKKWASWPGIPGKILGGWQISSIVDNLNNEAGFSGQAFFHPTAGTIGSLQRLQFDGPSQTQWDFGIIKRTAIREDTNFELRADFLNFLNHPLFYVGDYTVDSSTFGRITGLNFGPRVIQVAMKLNF